MAFQHRSYNSELFRPTPQVSYLEKPRLLIIATPWGPRSSAQKTIGKIQEYFLATQEDSEVTSPFERLSCLSKTANNLRTAIMLANDYLYREENRSEYVAGVELFAAAILGQELAWVQLGCPQVLLQRANRSLAPLSCTIDLTFDMSQSRNLLPPLPNQLLGLDASVNLTINSFRPQPGDQLILLSRSTVSGSLFNLEGSPHSMENIVQVLARDNPQLPFWLGLWDL